MSNTNMKITGVDVFVEAPLNARMPEQVGNFTLNHVSSRGLKLTSGAEASVLDVGWLCARYTVQKDAATNDGEIADLLSHIGKTYKWTSVMKLFEDNGKAAYT